MPDRDQPLDLLRELGDVGATPPRLETLRARVSSAIAEEIERESRPRRGGLSGSSSGRSTSGRFGGVRRRPGFPRLAGGLVPALGVLVVALVVGVFLGLRGSGPSGTTPSHSTVAPSRGSVELVYLAEPTPQSPTVTRGALDRTVQTMQARLRALGIGPAHVSVSGPNGITVILPDVRNIAEAEQAVGTTAQLSFYDWEANVLTSNGKTVASQLQSENPSALTISQGAGGNSAPGNPGSGSMGLYQAVELAANQRGWSSPANSRIGPQYWMFGAPGSAACAAAARAQGIAPVAGQHCLLSGPDDSLTDLRSGLSSGVSASEGQILTVPRGWVVLQAIPANFSHPTPIGAPNAQFFVLKDNIARGVATSPIPSRPRIPTVARPTSRSVSARRARRRSRT
jgi:hypothetical protein